MKIALTRYGVKPSSSSGRHSPRKNAVVIPARMVAGQKVSPHVLWEDVYNVTFAIIAARKHPGMVRNVVTSHQALADRPSRAPLKCLFLLKLALIHQGVEPCSGSGRYSHRKKAVVIPGRVVAVVGRSWSSAISSARKYPVMLRKTFASHKALA